MRGIIVGRRGAYVEPADSLVLADVHVGRGEASDVAFPVGERDDLRDRLAGLLDRFDPTEVIFAGDVLHAFDRATDRAKRGLRALTDACRAATACPVFVAGNHDGLLSSIVEGPVRDAYPLGNGTIVCHGHAEPDLDADADADRYVIGHEHPTIVVEGDRHPCFLSGKGVYRGGDLLVLPAFTRLAAGVEVNGMAAADFDSPLIGDADALRPVVRDPAADETYEFPPLGEFRRLL